MLDPELMLFLGGVVVIISVLLLTVAYQVRGWFFIPEPRVELQPVQVPKERR